MFKFTCILVIFYPSPKSFQIFSLSLARMLRSRKQLTKTAGQDVIRDTTTMKVSLNSQEATNGFTI